MSNTQRSFGMGMPNKRNYFNVTVVDRDEELLSVGEKQLLFFVQTLRNYFEKYQNSIDYERTSFYNSI